MRIEFAAIVLTLVKMLLNILNISMPAILGCDMKYDL